MSIDDKNIRISINLRKLRVMLDRTLSVTDQIEDLHQALLEVVDDIASEVGSIIKEDIANEKEGINDMIKDTEMPSNVIPLIKKETGDEPTKLA
jgi:hypothetical protein